MGVIFLCGFMGCGKTTTGKRLAIKLGCDFVDMDDFIEKEEGCTIAEIFEKKGEEYFRLLETSAITLISQLYTGTDKDAVVATGGGAMQNERSAAAAKSCGKVVFLDAGFLLCYRRIGGDKNRPLAAKSNREQLQSLYSARRPVYIKNSGHTVRISAKMTMNQILEEISRKL